MKHEGLTGEESERPAATAKTSWRERARFRRRLRYLRSVRELALRDLGGLIFDMYRFGSKRQDLVKEKLDLMFSADNELYTLEGALGDQRLLHELRIPGVRGTCPECGTLNSSDARFCSNCAEPLRTALRPGSQPPAPAPAPAPPAEPTAAVPFDGEGEDEQVVAAELDHQAFDDASDEGGSDEEAFDEEVFDEDELPADDYGDEEFGEEFDELEVEPEHDQPTTSGNGRHNGPAQIEGEGPLASRNGPADMSAGDPLRPAEEQEPPANGSPLDAGDPLAAPRDEPHR